MRPGKRLAAGPFGKLAVVTMAAITALTVGGCAGAGSFGSGGEDTVTIAIMSNSQMQDAISLSDKFEAENPGIKLKFVSLSENEARAKITASVATGGGEFDVVMISNFETPQWAENGWLVDLSDYARETPNYDEQDFIPSLRKSLVLRRRFVFGAVLRRVVVPVLSQGPVQAGRRHHPGTAHLGGSGRIRRQDGRSRRHLRHLPARQPGWGENLAPLNTVINTFGGRWFDENWNAQLTSPESPKPCSSTSTRSASTASRARRRVASGMCHAARPGQHGDVVRRHLRSVGLLDPGRQHGGRQDRLRAGTGLATGGQAGSTPGRWASRRPPRTRTRRGSSSPG